MAAEGGAIVAEVVAAVVTSSTTKVCTKCGRELDLATFAVKSNRSGVKSWCRVCDATRSRARYRRNRPATRMPRAASLAAEARRLRVADLRRDGLTVKQIAAHLGATVDVIEWDIRQLLHSGRVVPTRHRRTADQETAAVLAGSGCTLRSVARQLGVSLSTVQRWLAARPNFQTVSGKSDGRAGHCGAVDPVEPRPPGAVR